ncbi:MAG: NAD(P)-dependent alcohol dehydrogenase [Deltaproteobacteria bacterium]|nr:NAD(P)-dependent alcohol dehydrogenase [Deltaproteobacteria bacterium]
MKAIIYTKYGEPDVLELKEVEKPVPKDNEVLIKVYAASINDWDKGLLIGKPFINRLFFGLFRPRQRIIGCDIAGRVTAVGAKVTHLKPGDAVFGDLSGCGFGGFAEYVCARENALTLKPVSMTFEQAAATPQAACLALQGVRKGNIQQGQKVLINGAGGGAGSFTLQMAKSKGATVTGVDSFEKFDVMRSIGADHVIDFTQEDFTKNGECYDVILDQMAYHSILDYKRALSPKGSYVTFGGSMLLLFKVLLLGPFVSMLWGKKMGILMLRQNKGMDSILELFEAGKIKPVIDRTFPLNEAAEAMQYFVEGHAKGKVVITMEDNDKN